MGKQFATREELIEAIIRCKSKAEISKKFGYTRKSLNQKLYLNFGMWKLECLKTMIASGYIERLKPVPKPEKAKSPLGNNMPSDRRTEIDSFAQPIAAQDFRTRKGYSRIEEIWAREGLS